MPNSGKIFLYLGSINCKRIFTHWPGYEKYFSWQCRDISKYRLKCLNRLDCPDNIRSINISDIKILRLHTNRCKTQHICWNCKQTIGVIEAGTLFCDSCKCLQPVDKQCDFFVIMGVECSYKINLNELKQKFRNLQSLLHPDKFSSKSKKEQELSEEFSSHVNKAYSTLLDPLERGLYLLNLQSISIDEGTSEENKQFLMQIMESNEELENESSPDKLSEIHRNNKKQIDLLVSQVESAFDKSNEQLAKKLLTELKYYYSIENKIKEKKQKLNIPN